MRKSVIYSVIISVMVSAIVSSNVSAAQIKVLDKTLKPAGAFLAYTEFELSGEPLAEALGLDLDILDPSAINQPTAFDYTAGIESYEYSEEAMYALNYQSTMGPHLANGPLNKRRGGTQKSLSARIIAMADTVGLAHQHIPRNIYPISMPYVSGMPEFVAQPDVRTTAGEALFMLTASGVDKEVTTLIPNYTHDYKSLAWDSKSFDMTFNPAAIGGIFLKEVMWSQDFLGGMHVTATDEEVEAQSSRMDNGNKYSLGVSAADGFNGMLLTEMSIDKLIIMQQQLGYDGKVLGAKFTPNYDPQNGPIWFASRVAVTQGNANNLNSIESLAVVNGASTLRDTWQMLWPVAEFFAFTDQRTANTGQNPAFNSVFDGAPFAAAPSVNIDANMNNDTVAQDAFSLANNISNLVFKNIAALHFNKAHGTFVTEYVDGKQGALVDTFDAAYSIVALSIYQRAKDALPVGYASADSGATNLQTKEGQQALAMIRAQADFIIAKLLTRNGLVVDTITLNKKTTTASSVSLISQFAAIRGLVAAFLSTDDVKYKTAARKLYLAVEKHMFDKNINTWADVPGKATIHTPYTQAAISGGLRDVILQLKNEEGEDESALELQTLVNRYVAWFSTVINGGMQLAESIGDTGEVVIKQGNTGDNDNDGVKQITAAGGLFGTAATMANKAIVK